MTALSGRTLSGAATLPPPLASIGHPGGHLASAAAASAVISLAAGGCTVLLRRICGGFASPPPLVLAWLTVLLGVTAIVAVDMANRVGLVGRWARVVGRFGLVALVLAIVPFGRSLADCFAAMVPLGIAATVALLPAFGAIRLPWQHVGGHRADLIQPQGAPPTVAPLTHAPVGAFDAPLPPGCRQRLERFQSSVASDRVIGRVLVDVPIGSRAGHAHLGFCPPFAAMPVVEVASVDDGFEAVVTAAEIVPWGVRVECRLSEPAEELLAIPVDVVAFLPG